LCAYTGGRISEIAQLRKSDVVALDDIWCIKFDPEAGPLKNAGSERLVPIHSALLDGGFLAFVEGVTDGPLFPSLPVDKFGKRGGNGTKLVGRWVRSLGLIDPRLSPSHSWRHRFKTSARRYGLATDIVDAIAGHASRSIGDSYGEFPVEALKRELEKLPSILVAKPKDGTTADAPSPVAN
jgi:integrase